jgi:hypothetical protein
MKRQYDAKGHVTRKSFYDDNNNPMEDGGIAVITFKYDETGTLTDLGSYNLKGAEVPLDHSPDSVMGKNTKEQRDINGRIEKTSFYESLNGKPIQVNGVAVLTNRYDKEEKLIETKGYDINGAEVDLKSKYFINKKPDSQTNNIENKDKAFTVFGIPLNASLGDVYSILEKKDVDVKNEQFMDIPMKGSAQILRIHRLPEEMISQGIIDGSIMLGAYNQEEPRSFFINFKFADQINTNIIDILNKKYGSPKLYYSSENWADPRLSAYRVRLIEHLKSISASAKPVETNNVLYPDIINNLIVADETFYLSILQSFKVFKESHGDWAGPTYETFIFEWEKDDVKTFLYFAVYYSYSGQKGNITNLTPVAITYVHMPLAEKVTGEIGRAISQAKQAKAEINHKGMAGF